MNKFLFFCTVLFAFSINSMQAQENIDVYITTDSSIATIEITIPNGVDSYQFSNILPGYFQAIFPQDYIENYTLVSNNKSLETLYLSNQKIEFDENISGQKLQYKVHENYQSQNFIPVCTKFSGDWQLFNFAYLLGEFNSIYAEYSIYIDNNLIDTKPLVEWYAEPYFQAKEQHNFSATNFNISTHQSIISQNQLKNWISEATQIFENTSKRDCIFIFDDLAFQSGAIAHDSTIVFYFDEKDLIKNAQYLIQKTIVHELLHGELPEAINHPHEKSKIWLSEGLTEYLAIKRSLQYSLISEAVFLEKMMEKQRLATKTKNSLEELSNSLESQPENYQHFYSKGVIACWLMDLQLRKATQNGVTLENIIYGEFDFSQHQLIVNETMADFEEKYVVNNESIPFNDMISYFGLLYEYQKNGTFYPIEQIKINGNGEIVATSNIYEELQIGDTIIALNNEKKITEIKACFGNPTQENYTLTFLKNGKKQKIEIARGQKCAKINYHNFSFIKELNEEQIENWRKFINL